MAIGRLTAVKVAVCVAGTLLTPPFQLAELIFVANLHGIGAVQWQTLRITHPVQLRRSLLVSP
jgi:hypothetical protein